MMISVPHTAFVWLLQQVIEEKLDDYRALDGLADLVPPRDLPSPVTVDEAHRALSQRTQDRACTRRQLLPARDTVRRLREQTPGPEAVDLDLVLGLIEEKLAE